MKKEQHIDDLKELENTPYFKVSKKTNKIEPVNIKDEKQLKLVQEKIKSIEQNQKKLERTIEELKSTIRRTVNLSKFINDKIMDERWK